LLEGEPLDLPKVAQYYGLEMGLKRLREKLNEVFGHDFPFLSLHDLLADKDLVPAPLLIVTTNYDDLIERAFRNKGRAFDLVIHTTDSLEGEYVVWMPHGKEPAQGFRDA